jgi:hypothetical protein
MITGSSSSNNYTSGEIFSNLMALAAVPTAVAALKTVKVARRQLCLGSFSRYSPMETPSK